MVTLIYSRNRLQIRKKKKKHALFTYLHSYLATLVLFWVRYDEKVPIFGFPFAINKTNLRNYIKLFLMIDIYIELNSC